MQSQIDPRDLPQGLDAPRPAAGPHFYFYASSALCGWACYNSTHFGPVMTLNFSSQQESIDFPMVGDLVLLNTGSESVQRMITPAGQYRGFLRTTTNRIPVSGIRRFSGPKDPHCIGVVLDRLNRGGLLRGEMLLILWKGEILEGKASHFQTIERTDV